MRHMKLQSGDDGIATLTLDNADGSMNVVSDAWLDEMIAVIAQVRDDASVTALIVTSGKNAFMAGADLTVLVDGYGKLSRMEAYAFSQKASAMHRQLETMGKPVVAALNGLCLGGGFELALACHGRVLVDSPKAVVGLPEVSVGLLPGSGGTQRLPRLVGLATALDLLLSGRKVPPAEALKLKLVDQVVPAADRLEAARAWLRANPDPVRGWDKKGFATAESRGLLNPETALTFTAATAGVAGKAGYNLPAPAAILSCVFEGVLLPLDRALSVESKYFALLLTDPVARNIIRTTFISKQAAEKGARRPQGIAPLPISKIGVLGAGMMGAGIALVAAQSGIEVVLIDRDQSTADSGKAYSEKVFAKAVAKGTTTPDEAAAILGRITATTAYEGLGNADFVVEAVFEDTAVKSEVTRRAEAILPPDAVFGTNTSTLPITTLAEASSRPERFIGLHFFSPVERMGLVEVIVSRKTAPDTLARALDLVAALRKTPIVVNDSRGFYTSRVFQMLINEGAAMLADGVAPARIENAAKAAGFPVGPLALLDEVTMDLPIKIVEQAIDQEGPGFVPPAGMPVMYQMRELGRASRKAGGGFYDYPEGGKKKALWKGLASAFPSAAKQPTQDELKTRFLYVQAIETARCLEEGVLETPQDADLGAVLGWGFPAWTGGTLSYIDTIGLEEFVCEADRLAQAYGPRFSPSPWLRDKAARGQSFYNTAAEQRDVV